MPYRRKYRPTNKKRAPRRAVRAPRKRGIPRRRMPLVATLARNPFPKNMWKPLTYTTSFLLSNAVPTVPDTVSFRANSVYDPEVAVGGGQPRYFPTICGANDTAAIYQNYRVHGSSISLELWARSTTVTSANALVSIIPRRTTVSSPDDINEMKTRPLSRTRGLTGFYANSPKKLKHSIKIKSLLGHKDLIDVDNSAALYNANPNEEVYWDVSLVDLEGSASASTWCVATITYYCQFYTLNDVQD